MSGRKLSVLTIDERFDLAYPSEWARSIEGRRISFSSLEQPNATCIVSWREPHELEGLAFIEKCGFDEYLLSFTDAKINDHFDESLLAETIEDAETITVESGEWFHCATFIDLDPERQYFLGLLIHEPTRYFWYFQGEGPQAFITDSASMCRWIKHVDEVRDF